MRLLTVPPTDIKSFAYRPVSKMVILIRKSTDTCMTCMTVGDDKNKHNVECEASNDSRKEGADAVVY